LFVLYLIESIRGLKLELLFVLLVLFVLFVLFALFWLLIWDLLIKSDLLNENDDLNPKFASFIVFPFYNIVNDLIN